jgi:metallophosphoesterase (TIGR00282 family)
VRILFLADVYGAPGVGAIEGNLRALRADLELDCVIVNAENAADGAGLTPKLADRLLAAGADCLTLGNHLWRRKEIGPYLIEATRVVRPANLLDRLPGCGLQVIEVGDVKVAVINLLGSFTMEPAQSMFSVVDQLIDEAHRSTRIVVVDVHAEATSEKVAMGWHLAGRATAVLGTHTHVQTSDAQILPGGTGYITDLGMSGSTTGVIGMDAEVALKRFRSPTPAPYQIAEGEGVLHGIVADLDPESGKAMWISAFAHA